MEEDEDFNSFDEINKSFIINNENITLESELNVVNIYQECVNQSICKIVIDNHFIGTGFLIKFKKENKEILYFLMTCEHVLKRNVFLSNHKIKAYYNYDKNIIDLEFLKTKRNIKDYLYLDSMLIQILPVDNIPENYFLEPNNDQKQ